MGYEEAGRVTMNLLTTQIYFLTFTIVLFADAQPVENLDGDANNSLSIFADNNSTIPKNPVPRRSTESETIERAGEDLKNQEIGRRVGAAKLLGKYRNSRTSLLLVSALDDQSPLVRRAAMVSLAEHASNGFMVYNKSLVEKIY